MRGEAIGEMTDGVPESFRLGPFTVAPRLLSLHDGTRSIRLEPKVMAVLTELAAAAPDVVSADRLLDTVWGTRYASEDLPRRAVYELRKALGDDSRAPRFIETIPRSGYRLVAAVEPLRPNPAELPAKRRGTHGSLVAMALLAAASLFLAFLARGGRGAPDNTPRPIPLTATPGVEYEPAFSPDGSRIAFLRAPDLDEGSPQTLHVQLLNAESSVALNVAPADLDHPLASPTWSPDGTTIAFLRWTSGEGWGIHAVPAQGGSERKLAALGRVGAAGLAWSPDGHWLAAAVRADDGSPFAIHRFELESGSLRALTVPPPTSIGDRWPTFAPDGKRLAFVRTTAPETSEVHVVSAAGGESRSLLDEHHKIADLDWTDDGRMLLIAIFDSGRHRVWTVNVASGEVRRRRELGEDARWIAAARQGGKVVFGRARYRFALRRLERDTGRSEAVPELSSTYFDAALDLDPTGPRMTFASTRSGTFEIWVADLAGERPRRLTSFDGPTVGHPRWTPDGRSVIFHANPGGSYDLYRSGIEGGPIERLTDEDSDERVPSVSRDGSSLYFASDRSGGWQVWRMTKDREPVAMTRGGGYSARESTDGRWLYYTRWRQDGLWRMPTAGGEERQLLGKELPAFHWGNWLPTENGVYFVTRAPDASFELALLDPESGAIRRVQPLPSPPVQTSLAGTADGALFFYTQLEALESDLVFVENWSA